VQGGAATVSWRDGAVSSGADGRNPTVGVLWAIATATAYSLSSVVGKDLLGKFGAESVLFWRFGVASAMVWPVLLIWRGRGGPDPFTVPWSRALFVGVMFGLMVYTGFLSLQYLDVSMYIVLVYLYPVLVVVAMSLMGHHVSGQTWVALAVVMVGVVLTVPELFGGVGDVSALGVALVLLQACLMAAFMIVSSRLLPGHINGVVSAAWTVLGATLAMTPLALGGGLVVPHGASMIAKVLLFALVPTLLSSVFFYRALRHLPPGLMAMIMTVEVAMAIFLSVLFLGETVSGMQLLGAAVVIGGVLLAQAASVREARQRPEMDDAWVATPGV